MDYMNLQKEKIQQTIQKKKEKPNHTGIPDQIKRRFEDTSGFSFDDVQIHYHSDRPSKLQALAYTQGNQVYIGPGQERHLPHELGHVIQQKKGMVKANLSINGLPVNDDPALERDADAMPKKASYAEQENNPSSAASPVAQRMMSKEDFVRLTSPHFGVRGKHNGEYYNMIDPLLAEYEQSSTTGERKYVILIKLKDVLEKWTADRTNSSRAGVRSRLLNDVIQEQQNYDPQMQQDYEQALQWSSQNAGADFNANNIKFVSKRDGKVGSIYFNNKRRIRLTHRSGPEISQNMVDARYVLPDGKNIMEAFTEFWRYASSVDVIYDFLRATGFKKLTRQGSLAQASIVTYKQNDAWGYLDTEKNAGVPLPANAREPRYWKEPEDNSQCTAESIMKAYKKFRKNKTLDQIKHFLEVLGATPATANASGRLFELLDAGMHSHVSRGKPEPLGVTLTDKSVNLLYHAAQLGDNDTLIRYMQLDPEGLLVQIPVNLVN